MDKASHREVITKCCNNREESSIGNAWEVIQMSDESYEKIVRRFLRILGKQLRNSGEVIAKSCESREKVGSNS